MSRTIPQRTCIACGTKQGQDEFLRVVSQGGAPPIWDSKGRAPGRGAYLCRTAACVDKAFARRALERALKLQTPAPADLKAVLIASLEAPAQKAPQTAPDIRTNIKT